MAAKKLFSRQGFDGTTIRQICEEANANVALSFPDPDHSRVLAAVLGHGEEIARSGPPPRRFPVPFAGQHVSVYMGGLLFPRDFELFTPVLSEPPLTTEQKIEDVTRFALGALGYRGGAGVPTKL
ncbi:TetR family transcriptional regulator [Cohnella thermotolerans]|uniref:TetR family transcriptional regulator n=1 Tax=Cohnella thermotolerans TaxID=329858 RepID=UPI0004115B84|nr:TetR family transcriptional regulator [Cohnella thermotolerans]